MEPAELRYELGTMGTDILPDKEDLSKVFGIKHSGRNITQLTNLIRTIYINKYIKGNGLPCYAGINHVQITVNGNVWPCCILADSEPMGNLHKVNYDFKKIWFSKKADKIRDNIKRKI